MRLHLVFIFLLGFLLQPCNLLFSGITRVDQSLGNLNESISMNTPDRIVVVPQADHEGTMDERAGDFGGETGHNFPATFIILAFVLSILGICILVERNKIINHQHLVPMIMSILAAIFAILTALLLCRGGGGAAADHDMTMDERSGDFFGTGTLHLTEIAICAIASVLSLVASWLLLRECSIEPHRKHNWAFWFIGFAVIGELTVAVMLLIPGH